MQCEERNRLLKDYDVAAEKVVPYPESTHGVPQSFAAVQNAQQLRRTLHEKSVALEAHDKTHGCAVAPTKN
jgi:predicted alternative tryptophan synthase beta-subunit